MNLSRNLLKALNGQINAEMWSANLYLSMSIHFAKEGYDGFAAWMKAQSKEEMEHAYMMIDYVIKRNGEPTVEQINVVPGGWGSALEVFEHVYKHEVHVSGLIDSLHDLAIAEKDKATQDFMWQFIREQVEEEATARDIVDKIKVMGECNLAFLDNKLGQRK